MTDFPSSTLRLTCNAFILLCLFPAHAANASDVPIPTEKPMRQQLQKAREMPAVISLKTSCSTQLNAMKVIYKSPPPVTDPRGCKISQPVEVFTFSDGTKLSPPAVLECETAVIVAQFVRNVIQVEAIKTLGSTIKSVEQDSSYVCRARSGTTKLSEHAFGRALDIGAFVAASGETIKVVAQTNMELREAKFLSAIRASACGPFSTVLGPGSDADHASHFHFDLAPRKGKPFCQ